MRQIPWEFFAQRRNISYKAFSNMSYDQYTAWCARRNVIPLDENAYRAKVHPQDNNNVVVTPVTLPSNSRNYDPKTLSKKKKAELIDICILRGVKTSGKETKKQLVALLTAEQST